MKPIYYLLTIVLFTLGFSRCVEDPVIDTTIQNYSVPEISLTEKVGVSASSIELSASIIKENGLSVEECGFCWSDKLDTDPQVNISEKRYVVSDSKTGSSFTSKITGLKDNTKYYVYAYAINGAGTAFSPNAGVYSTNIGIGEVATCKIDADQIKATSVTVSGKIRSRGEGIEQLGFYWSEKNNEPSEKDSVIYYKKDDLNTVDSFSCHLTGLQPETKYFVRAFAKNKFGEFSYSVASFTTASGKPVVAQMKVDSISFTSLDLSAVIEQQGEGDLLAYGFCWGTDEELSIEESDTIICGNLNEEGMFSASIRGLEPNKIYNVCAFAVNTFGVVYTPIGKYSTKSDALVVSALKVEKDKIYNRKALVVGVLQNPENLQIDEIGFCWSTHKKNPRIDNGSTYVKLPMNSLEEDGTFSYYIKDLQSSKTYYFSAFLKKENGSYLYSHESQQFLTPDIFEEIIMSGEHKGVTFSSTFSLRNMLYILGGDKGSTCSNELYSYDYDRNLWTGLSPLFTEAGHMTVCTMNDHAYVMGGLTKSGILSNLTEYDYVLNRWRDLKAMPTACFDAHSFVYRDSVYVVGGSTSSEEKSSRVYRYDVKHDKWKLVTERFPVRQKNGISFILGDTVYVGLGEGSENRLWMASDALTEWKEVSAIPSGLHRANSLIHYNKHGVNSLFLLDNKGQIWESDLITNQWKKRSAVFPDEVFKNSSLILVDDKIFILGQKDNNTTYLKRYNFKWDPICDIVE